MLVCLFGFYPSLHPSCWGFRPPDMETSMNVRMIFSLAGGEGVVTGAAPESVDAPRGNPGSWLPAMGNWAETLPRIQGFFRSGREVVVTGATAESLSRTGSKGGITGVSPESVTYVAFFIFCSMVFFKTELLLI